MEKIRKYFYNVMTDEDERLLSRPLKFALWALSLLYWVALVARDLAYRFKITRAVQLEGVKVISVGNITFGGTGKTPMAIRLATLLTERGKKVAVLLRGYGADEYEMLKDTLKGIPVIKGSDRIRSGREAIDAHKADTLILDDGFQCRKIKKDLNIVLVNSRNPFGNGHLLPRGILRDRISNLKHADVIVLTKTSRRSSNLEQIRKRIGGIAGDKEVFSSAHMPWSFHDVSDKNELPLDFIRKKRVASLSAIGDPRYFNDMLEGLGAEIAAEFSFTDHHEYTVADIRTVVALCRKNGLDTVVTTEKDACKLAPRLFAGERLRLVSLKIRIDFAKDEDKFTDRLLGIYGS